MKKIDPEKWKDSFKWQYEAYPFFTSVYNHAADKNIKNKYFADFSFLINLFQVNHLSAYQPRIKIVKIGKMAIRESLAGDASYLKEVKKIHARIKKAINKCLQIKKTNEAYKDLKCWWPQTQKALSCAANIIFCFDYTFDGFLNELKIKNEKDFEIINRHIYNKKRSFMDEAGKKLLELNEKHPDNFDKVFFLFKKDFGWFQNSYKGIFDINKKWLSDYLRSMKSKKNKETRAANPNLELPCKYKILVELANEIIVFRDDKKKLLLLAVSLMEPWLKDLAKNHKWSFEALRWLSMDEILKISKNRDLLFLEKAIKYMQEDKRLGIMTDGGYDDMDDNFWKAVQKYHAAAKNIKMIKGLPASRGVYRGRVKIVLDAKKESGKFKKGDILVTSMTRPEFFPLMSRAGAFITDEGGISCHAAIIAREMKKPCIIGTKIATQVLHDGDLAEVDADLGIVKIL